MAAKKTLLRQLQSFAYLEEFLVFDTHRGGWVIAFREKTDEDGEWLNSEVFDCALISDFERFTVIQPIPERPE